MPIPLIDKLLPYLRSRQFLSLLGNLVASGLAVVSVSLLFRALSAGQVGAWVFFITLLGLGDAFRSGFVTTGFIRSYAGASAPRAAEVVGATWVLTTLLTLALVALVLLGRLWPGVGGNASVLLFVTWFPLTFVLTLPSFLATAILQAQQRFDKLLYLRLLTQGTFILGILGLMLTHRSSLAAVMYCYLAAAALTSAVCLGQGWARLADWRFRTAACVRELAHFGKYSVGSYIGSSLLRSSDTFIINYLLGPAPLAVYNLAQRFMEIIEIPLRSFLATAIPALSAAYHRHDLPEMSRIIRRNAGLLTWLLLPVAVGTVLLAEIPIYLIGGRQYLSTEAPNVLRLVICLAVLLPIDRFSGVALDVLNKPDLNLVKVFMMLAINVVGDFIGIRWTGNIYGVALASFPTFLAGFVFGYYLLSKSLPITAWQVVRTGWAEVTRVGRRLLGRPAAGVST